MENNGRRIYKYPLQLQDVNEFLMPDFADVLTVQMQDGSPCIWALVNPDRPMKNRKFRIFGTGHPVPWEIGAGMYVGTFQMKDGKLVFHLFEV